MRIALCGMIFAGSMWGLAASGQQATSGQQAASGQQATSGQQAILGQHAGPVVRRIGPANSRISSVVWVGDTLYVSGTMAPVDYAADKARGIPAGYRGDTKAQATGALRAIETVLHQQGLGLGDIVQMQAFVVGDPAKGGGMDREGWDAAYDQFFGTAEQPNKPVRATVQVARTVIASGLIEIMVVAVRSGVASGAAGTSSGAAGTPSSDASRGGHPGAAK